MTQNNTTLGTIITHTTKTGKTTYKYMLDGKVLRTSVRKNYRYSTLDGLVFSSRLDLLYKNETYVREYTWATKRANLTLEALIAERYADFKRAKKEYATYTSKEALQKEIDQSVRMYSHYATPTPEHIKKTTDDYTRHFNLWADLAKERMEKHSALLNDPDALNEELARLNRGGKARLAELQIVEYVDED